MTVLRRPLVALATGAAAVSLAPILVKFAAQWNVGPMAIGMWRCAFGGAVLATLIASRGHSLQVERRLMVVLACAGVAFAADLTVWHHSIFLAGAGLATILGNTQVFFTAVLATFLFHERLTFRFLLAAAAALVGLVLLVGIGSDVEFTAGYVRGIVLGLATGLLYAVFLTLVRVAALKGGNVSTLVRTAWFSIVAALALVPLVVRNPEGSVPDAWQGWIVLALLAVIAQVFGWWIISASVARVPSAIAGLVLMLQPVLATVWSAILFGESLAPLQVFGALITLAAIYFGSVSR